MPNCGAVSRTLAKERPVDLQQLPTDWAESLADRAAAPLPDKGGGVMGGIPHQIKRTPGLHPERPVPETKPD